MIGDSAGGRHFACTMPSVLLRRLRKEGGEQAVADVLERSGCTRTLDYLDDVSNWISYEEAMALFDAAEDLTGDPDIARRVGEQTVAQHAGTPVATLLRSLGSPEEVLSKIALTAGRFTTVTEMEAVDVTAGRAVVRAREREGFVRGRHHCNWTAGLLSQTTILFGLPAATVE